MANKTKPTEQAQPAKTAPTTTSEGVPSAIESNNKTETVIVAVDGNVLKERDAGHKIAVSLKEHSDKYTNLKGAVHVCEGYVWGRLKNSYPETQAGKSEFEELVKLTGLGPRMVARYIQLADKLMSLRILNGKAQVMLDAAIEETGEVSPEIVEVVADRVGRGKTMTDLMREVGILPPLDVEAKAEASLKEKMEGAGKQLILSFQKFSEVADQILASGDAVLMDQVLPKLIKYQESLNTLAIKLEEKLKSLEDDLKKIENENDVVKAEMEKQQTEIADLEAQRDRLSQQPAA